MDRLPSQDNCFKQDKQTTMNLPNEFQTNELQTPLPSPTTIINQTRITPSPVTVTAKSKDNKKRKAALERKRKRESNAQRHDHRTILGVPKPKLC